VGAVAAVSPPLDLGAVQRAIDAPWCWPYRHHLLEALKEIYGGVARRRAVPTPVEQVARARTIREFDTLVIVPRFGFRDADDYYERAGVGSRLGRLRTPALVVASTRDPMVPAATLVASVEQASSYLEMRWVDAGGHLYFPTDGVSLEEQVVRWLLERCG
jgi:predicted alpha/beta-fold hydrolase